MPQESFKAPVLSAELLSPKVTCLSLGMPQGFRFNAGQFLIVSIPAEPGSDKQPRGYYSIASQESRPQAVDLVIEHQANMPSGLASGYMASRKPGDVLTVEGPLGRFTLQEEAPKNLFLGVGAGGAPLRGMIITLLERGVRGRVGMINGGRGGEMLFDAQYRALAEKHPCFHYTPLPMPEQGGADPADMALDRAAAYGGSQGMHLYICGFSRDVDPMLDKLLAKAFRRDQMTIEKFG